MFNTIAFLALPCKALTEQLTNVTANKLRMIRKLNWSNFNEVQH